MCLNLLVSSSNSHIFIFWCKRTKWASIRLNKSYIHEEMMKRTNFFESLFSIQKTQIWKEHTIKSATCFIYLYMVPVLHNSIFWIATSDPLHGTLGGIVMQLALKQRFWTRSGRFKDYVGSLRVLSYLPKITKA